MLLPGSRNSEVSRLLPILAETVQLLEERGQGAHYMLPAVPHLHEQIQEGR